MTHTHTLSVIRNHPIYNADMILLAQLRQWYHAQPLPRITSYSGSSFDWTLTASSGACLTDIPYAGFLAVAGFCSGAKPPCCLLLILKIYSLN